MAMHTQNRRASRPAALAVLAAAAVVVSPCIGATAASSATSSPARSWSALMQRSLGPSPESLRLKALVSGLQTAAPNRSAAVLQARSQQSIAQTSLAAAVAAQAVAQSGLAVATSAATKAQHALTAAIAHRPTNKAAIRQARRQVKTTAAVLRRQAKAVTTAAATLRAAQINVQQAAATVTTAVAAWQTTNVAIRNAQQKLASLPRYDAALAAQAGTYSSAVVTDARANFTPADTTQVNGITVNKTIAYELQRMITDAAQDGIALSGGGFRTKQQQIQLRVVNGCPDIWTAPASSCKVPTAIPGRSLHELGLAVDFTVDNKTIRDRTGPAFTWLTLHAAQYGLANLPSEPWHWSITGN